MIDLFFVAAVDDKLGLARKGKIPWDIPSDRKYFRDHVENGPVLMGWKTYETNRLKPFGKGKNYVVTSEPRLVENVEVVHDPIEFVKNQHGALWVVGGGMIFKELIPYAHRLYITRVKGDYECDVFFPDVPSNFIKTESTNEMTENGHTFWYEIWERNT